MGWADALGDEVRSVDHLAEICLADEDALYRLLRALAGIGITEETSPETFSADSIRKTSAEGCGPVGVPAVIFWADLLADNWSLLGDCVCTGKPASEVC